MLPNNRKPYSRTKKRVSGSNASITEGTAATGARRKKKIPWYKKVLQMMVPTKKDSTVDKIRKVIFDVAIVVFIGSCAYLISYYGQSGYNANFYNGVASMLGNGEVSENYPRAYLTKFASLWEMNEDIVGWLSIDGTQVNYPVVQSDDNDYYLHKDFSKADNKYGIPFADCRVDISKPSTNIPIYSHNMKDGQMFGELINYQSLDYYKQHPVINFDSLYEEGKYKIVGMFIASTLPEHAPNFEYHNFIEAETDQELMDFANEVLSRSLIVTGVDIQPGDHLITLSTCTYDFEEARFAIVARRVREGEAETVDTSAAYINPNPVMPKAWYEAKKIAALVAGVSLSPENLSLQPGETAALTATVLPNTAVNRNVSWSSSDSSVASVDQSGNVTALRSGTAVITVTTEESGFTASATVTVGAGPITSMYFSTGGVNIPVGGNTDLAGLLTVEPEGASRDGLTWSSSDSSVASVSGGSVSGKKVGSATITVTAPSGVSASITVQVGTYIPIEGIGIGASSNTVAVGDSISLTLTITPGDATNQQQIEWGIDSGKRNVSLSGSGKSATVTGLKAGTTATIYAGVNDNGEMKYARITISITDKIQAPTDLEFQHSEASIGVNNSGSLLDILDLNPVGASTGQLTWVSSDPTVARVENGIITGLSDGVVTITVSAPNGATASIRVRVGNGASSSTPEPSSPASSSEEESSASSAVESSVPDEESESQSQSQSQSSQASQSSVPNIWG